MKLDDLIAACVAAPDDDEPRLVWADAVGGERGELVVVQCKLARGDLTPEHSRALRRRQRELLLLPRPEWSGLSGIASHVAFRRGFVEAAAIDAGQFVEDADAIFRNAPLLRSLTATGLSSRDALPTLTRLFESPALQRLGGLLLHEASLTVERVDVGQYSYEENFDTTYFLEPAIEIARRLGTLGHLRAFGAKWSGAARNVAGVLDRVERYWHRGTTDDVTEIVRSLPSLRALDVDHYGGIRVLIPHLPSELRELRVLLYTLTPLDDVLEELARQCPKLERLAIEQAELSNLEVLGHFPHLRSLRLTGTRVHDLASDAPPLPALRELGVFRLNPDAARRLIDRFGKQLDVIDLTESGLNVKIDKLFAGDVVAYPTHVEYEPLMFAEHHASEPWWERTTVTP